MTRKRLKVALGDISPLFELWCQRQGLRSADAILDFVRRAVNGVLVDFEPPKTVTVWADAGELHDPFLQWCAERGISSSAALRSMILHLLLAEAQPGQAKTEAEALPTQGGAGASMLIGQPDAQRQRMELRLSHSEMGVLTTMAGQRKVSVQRLVLQVLRAFLLKTPAFTADEMRNLGAINLGLLRIGNNLNQITRHLHSPEAGSEASPGMEALARELNDCIQAIRTHVDGSSAALGAARERWQIELAA